MAINPQSGSNIDRDDPGEDGFAITPSDATELATIPRAIYVGTGGTLIVRGASSSVDVTFKNVQSGSIIPYRAQFVRATGTTATDLVAII